MSVAKSSMFPGFSLFGLFGPRESTRLEHRVLNLPLAVERRQGPSCDNCGFGRMFIVPPSREHEGRLRCDRPGCGYVCDRPADSQAGAVIVRPS